MCHPMPNQQISLIAACKSSVGWSRLRTRQIAQAARHAMTNIRFSPASRRAVGNIPTIVYPVMPERHVIPSYEGIPVSFSWVLGA